MNSEATLCSVSFWSFPLMLYNLWNKLWDSKAVIGKERSKLDFEIFSNSWYYFLFRPYWNSLLRIVKGSGRGRGTLYCLGVCSSMIFFAILAISSSHPVLISWSSSKGYLKNHPTKMSLLVQSKCISSRLMRSLELPGSLKGTNSLTEVVLRVSHNLFSQFSWQIDAFLFSYKLQDFNNLIKKIWSWK